jgi:pantetheine-phosphate adenylyltransferase
VKIGVYAGTFDPITYGHIDILRRSLRIFDRVAVAVARNPKKEPLFSIEERVEMIRESVRDLRTVEVEAFDGLLVELLKMKKASAIIRGLRATSDFEHEFLMALMNRKLDPKAETVFLMPSEEYTYLSSSTIKEVARFRGEVKDLVPPIVVQRLREKFSRI